MKSVKLRPLLFLIFIQYLAIPSISAQEITIENASKKGLKGVRIMDQNGYYVQFAEKTEDEGKKAFNFRFVILNNVLRRFYYLTGGKIST